MINKSNFNFNILIIIYTCLLMLFCTKASPFLNIISGDSSVFFAVGRAMTKGKIVFKELFDHKGFYLYLLNYTAALISDKSSLGIFIVETCFMIISALMIFKTCRIFYRDEKIAFLTVAALMIFILSKDILQEGNLTEEYTLTLQLISIYLLLKDLYQDNSRHRPLYMLDQGVLAGIAIGFRPNAALIWLPIAVLIGFDLLFINRGIKLFFKNLFCGLAGLAIGLAPMIIYCVINDALADMIFCVFKFNMLYVDNGLNFIIILKRIIAAIAMPVHRALFIIILISALFIYKSNSVKFYNKLYYFAMLAASIIAVSLSGRRYGHYYEYIVPFCMPAVIEISAKIIELKPQLKYRYRYLFIIIFIASCYPNTATLARIGRLLSPALRQYMDNNNIMRKCAEININKKYFSPDEKVLITGFNHEFYNYMNLIPSEKYFYIPAISYKLFPDAVDAQINSILSCKNDVIIIRFQDDAKIFPEANRDSEIKEVLNNYYDLLFSDEQNKVEMYGKKR